MRLGIMQPYFLPYIGYFQLIAAVDKFVVYDNIEYTKKGWINRNRILLNGEARTFSLPIKKASDFLLVSEREISPDFKHEKLFNQFKGAYHDAPYYAEVSPVIEQMLSFGSRNLFEFVFNSIELVCDYLEIDTEICISSSIQINHEEKSEKKVLAFCDELKASEYINSIGGRDLYSQRRFLESSVELRFLRPLVGDYPQLGSSFVEWLSIVDVMMFNSKNKIKSEIIPKYELV